MWFIPSYVIILFITIFIDYYAAIHIEESESKIGKKKHLIIGIVNTCIVLFFFKYYNFFVDNLNYLGFTSIKHWDIILPIGLSFHVFQSLSYVIEVYRGNIRAERNLLIYSNFVMMFPQLVAGPIERADNMLPQLRDNQNKVSYTDFSIGFGRFFWGLFKKVAVADVVSQYVDAVYNNYLHHSGSTLLLATFLFAIQIYCDFSGYSDMAIGVARMLGFKFKENFSIPYFSKSVTEFWRRWHISLSSWLKDYIYISFGGNRKGTLITYRNLLLTMLIGGLWHGASWNFVIWGGLNGIYLSFEKLLNISMDNPKNIIVKLLRIGYVFVAISFTWIFFRASTLSQAKYIAYKIITDLSPAKFNSLSTSILLSITISLLLLLLFEFFLFRKHSFDKIYLMKHGKKYLNILTIFFIIYVLLNGNFNGAQFIYFQF
ncbi:MBOAT family protein [Emticicia sp. C21]|uniref:MBOAT family O-acyltransferase n=1 Tax=Emticicia sp. C21 TaxID=2302915 RepID=UPI001314F648|nr:MBOAT family O-acyltransferase [Emticicia sp. C21]